MDPNVEFVRLRSMADDKYVHASDDGCSVRLDARQESYNTIWSVEKRGWTSGLAGVLLLRGVYGRYLGGLDGSSSCFPSLRVVGAQLDFDESEVEAIMWRPAQWEENTGRGKLRSVSGYHLTNVLCRTSPQPCFWKADYIPPSRIARPRPSVDARPKWVKKVIDYLQSLWSKERCINWVLADSSGNIDEKYWGNFMFTGRDISSLEKQLHELVTLPTTLCIRAGRHGKPTRLCVDLPKSKGPFNIVLFMNDTPGGARLVLPEVRHQVGELQMTRS